METILNSTTLPHHINPQNGIIASANNKPYSTNIKGVSRINWFFPSNDRVLRLYEILEAKENVTLSDMKTLQIDVQSSSHIRLKNALVKKLEYINTNQTLKELVDKIKKWDGKFTKDSKEALIYHALLVYLSEELYNQYPQFSGREIFESAGLLPKIVLQDLNALSKENSQILLLSTLNKVQMYLAGNNAKVWGDIHRLQIGHLLGNMPILGYKYQKENVAIDGYDTTIFKTAGNLSLEEHTTSYGSQSRHVSDMSDDDANFFVLYGGQDGHLESDNAYDQVPLWQEGKYIQVPLHTDKIRKIFKYHTPFSAY